MNMRFILFFIILVFSFKSFSYSVHWDRQKKQNYIWRQIENTKYVNLPKYEKTDLAALFANLWANHKRDKNVDIIDSSYSKGIHRRSTVAKVRFIPGPFNMRESLLGGFDSGLLRLSLTEVPDNDTYKPGIALKVFINGAPSANVSMLVNLDGFSDSNVFSETYSNIVPKPVTTKGKLGVALFRLRSKYPMAIKADKFSSIDEFGVRVSGEKLVKQIYLVPSMRLKNGHGFSGDPRDYLKEISVSSTLFHVYARLNGGFEYSVRQAKDEYLGEIVLDSKFVSSSFGDDNLFFNHEFVDGD